MKMTPDQALHILAQASSEFKGTARDHETIGQAIKVIANLIRPKEESKNEVPKTG
jgi:hypothetical protein